MTTTTWSSQHSSPPLRMLAIFSNKLSRHVCKRGTPHFLSFVPSVSLLRVLTLGNLQHSQWPKSGREMSSHTTFSILVYWRIMNRCQVVKIIPHSFLQSIIHISRVLQSTVVVTELHHIKTNFDYASNKYICFFVSTVLYYSTDSVLW